MVPMIFLDPEDPANNFADDPAPPSTPKSLLEASPLASLQLLPGGKARRATLRRARIAFSSAAVRAFGGEVRRRRVALNMTLESLAEQAGVSATYLSAIERGERRRGLSLNVAFRIAKGMGTDIPDLVGGYMGLSPEGIEAARLLVLLPRRSRLPILDLIRSLAGVSSRRPT
jgi:transcriptional regulator with XRE-family HTH domain